MADREWRVAAADAEQRLDKFLGDAGRLGSRARASDAIRRGKVFVNGAEAGWADAGRRLAAGDSVRIWEDRPGTAKRRATRPARRGELSILYQDEALVIVNKPPGLLAVPLPKRGDEPSVQDALVEHLRSEGKRKPLVVHRIDRDTSGVVVFATRRDVHAALKDQFRRREPERVYLAVVYGVPSPPAGTWRDHLVWDQRALIQKETHPRDPKGKEAVSRYRVVESFGDTSLLEVSLVTGRRNQIRLQARLRGHTLVGEERYVYGPDSLRPVEFGRQALHAFRLGFIHPLSRRLLRVEAPVPVDFAGLLSHLRRKITNSRDRLGPE